MVLLQALLVLPELLNPQLASCTMSCLKLWAQSFFMGTTLVGLNPMYAKIPECCTPKSTKLTQSHLANTTELHWSLNTVLVPVVDQVKLGFGSWLLMPKGCLGSKWLAMSDLSNSQ